MKKRVAFLIGNQTFLPDSGLPPLQGPENDLAALARLLRDPRRGQFEVHEFLDKAHHEVLPDLEQALSSAAFGDLFLIYYSGHGKLASRTGQLCLATANTRQDALLSTSILARQLSELVEVSKCDQVVLLLDCCYSGAVDMRGDVGSELHVVDDAHGFYIMTASTSTQSARETLSPGGVVMGSFTAALVVGIESGIADRGLKGKILLSDLRHYLGQAVTGSTPQFFDRRASGDPLISLNPFGVHEFPVEVSAFLRTIDLFRTLTPFQLGDVAERMTKRHYNAGETIIRAGDKGEEFFVISDGEVDVIRADQEVARLGRGDFFGEVSLISGEPRNANVVATDPVETYVLTRNDFQTTLEQSVSFRDQLYRIYFVRH